MGDHGEVQTIERHLVIAPTVGMEHQRDIAAALAWSSRERRGRRDKARAHYVAVAVLEIVAGQLPFALRGHCCSSLCDVTRRRVRIGHRLWYRVAWLRRC